MKTFVSHLVLLLLSVPILAERHWHFDLLEPVFQTDSVYEYFWSSINNDWEFNGTWKDPHVHVYTRTDGLVTEILVFDRETGENVNKELKSYDEDGRLTSHIYMSWSGGDWTNTRRDLIQYDEKGRTFDFIIQTWNDSDWINVTRFTDYKYNSMDKVLEYTEQSWSNTLWVDFAIDTRTYDPEGFPLVRINMFIDGKYRYRQLYTWYDDGKGYELVHQPFDETLNDFRNGVKTIRYNNDCGQTRVEIRQQFEENQWVNYSKKIYFLSPVIDPDFGSHVKVAVCHRGHTLFIPLRALKAHLQHGDCVGNCMGYSNHKNSCDNKKSGMINQEMTGSETSLNIHPNPFSDQTEIVLPRDHNFHSLYIINMQGKVLRTITIDRQDRITIEKDDLDNGLYIFRFVGEAEVRNLKVIIR